MLCGTMLRYAMLGLAMLCYASANELSGCCLATVYQLMEIILYEFGIKMDPF